MVSTVLNNLLKMRGHGLYWYAEDVETVEVLQGLIDERLKLNHAFATVLGVIFPGTENFWLALAGLKQKVSETHFLHGLFHMSPTSETVTYKMCKVRRPFVEFNHNPMSLVYRPGKLGLYIGEGKVALFNNGVVDIFPLEGWNWTAYALINDVKVLPSDAIPLHPLELAFEKEVSYGAEGKSIEDVQLALLEAGYISKADSDICHDGVFGKKTAQAILKLQRNSHLDETGILNSATIRALVDRLSKKV